METARKEDFASVREENLTLRIVKVEPPAIPESWDILKHALDTSIRPEQRTDASAARVRRGLENGALLAFLLLGTGSTNALLGALILQPSIDFLSGVKNVHILGLHTSAGLTVQQYREAFTWLKQVARDLTCTTITAVTARPELIQIVKSLGGDTSTTMIQFNLGD